MKKLILCCVLLLVSACGVKKDPSDQLTIVTTFFPTWSYAHMLAPDADIINIVGEAEAHGYEPSPRDIEHIQNADIFIYNGAGFESWVDSVLESIDLSNLVVVDASENISLLNEEGSANPHTWMNPKNAIVQMNNLLDALILVDEDHQESYIGNFKESELKLLEVDKAYDDFFSTVSLKEIVVDHEAYSYLLEPYGIVQKSIIGGIFDEEPTAKAIEATIDFIRSENVKAIYIEEFSNQKIANLIKSETGVSIYKLHTLESVSKHDIDSGVDLISLFKSNLDVLKKGMQ